MVIKKTIVLTSLLTDYYYLNIFPIFDGLLNFQINDVKLKAEWYTYVICASYFMSGQKLKMSQGDEFFPDTMAYCKYIR